MLQKHKKQCQFVMTSLDETLKLRRAKNDCKEKKLNQFNVKRVRGYSGKADHFDCDNE
jgi:hypothetical protein